MTQQTLHSAVSAHISSDHTNLILNLASLKYC